MDDSKSARRKPKRFFSDEFKRDPVRLIVDEKSSRSRGSAQATSRSRHNSPVRSMAKVTRAK
jgi:hypothetical protein